MPLPENLSTLSIVDLEDFRKGTDKETQAEINAGVFTEKLNAAYDKDPEFYVRQVMGLAVDKELSHPLRMAISSHVSSKTVPDAGKRHSIALSLLVGFSTDEENGFEFLDKMSDLCETFKGDRTRGDRKQSAIYKEILSKLPPNSERSFILQERAFQRISEYEMPDIEATANVVALESLLKHPPNEKEEEKVVGHLARIGDRTSLYDEVFASQIDATIRKIAETLSPDNAKKVQDAVDKRVDLYEFSDVLSAVKQGKDVATSDWTDETARALAKRRLGIGIRNVEITEGVDFGRMNNKLTTNISAKEPAGSSSRTPGSLEPILEFDAGHSNLGTLQLLESTDSRASVTATEEPDERTHLLIGIQQAPREAPPASSQEGNQAPSDASLQAPSAGRSVAILADARECVKTVVRTGKEAAFSAAAWAASCGRPR